MRIIINNTEFHIFKGRAFSEPMWYYHDKSGSLVKKFFEESRQYGCSDNTKTLVDMLKNSTKAPELNEGAKDVVISLNDQLKDLLAYLEKDFEIFMDDRNRFYRIVKQNKRIQDSTCKYKMVFIPWKEILKTYNMQHRYFYNWSNNDYIKEKYKNLNSLNKKYVYINLVKRKGEGFTILSEKLVSIPT